MRCSLMLMILPGFRHSTTSRTQQYHWNPGAQMARIALRAEEELSEFPLVQNLLWCMGFITQLGWKSITTASGASWVLVMGQALCICVWWGSVHLTLTAVAWSKFHLTPLSLTRKPAFPRSPSYLVAKLKLGSARVHTQPLHQWAHDTQSSITRTSWMESINKAWRYRVCWSGWTGGSTISCPSSLGKVIAGHSPCLKISSAPHPGVLKLLLADA